MDLLLIRIAPLEVRGEQVRVAHRFARGDARGGAKEIAKGGLFQASVSGRAAAWRLRGYITTPRRVSPRPSCIPFPHSYACSFLTCGEPGPAAVLAATCWRELLVGSSYPLVHALKHLGQSIAYDEQDCVYSRQRLATQTVQRLTTLEQNPFLQFHHLVQGKGLEPEVVIVKLLDDSEQVVGTSACACCPAG